MSKKHTYIILACCLIPLVVVGAILLFKIPANGVLLAGLALLYPIAHLLMMKFMLQEQGRTHQTEFIEGSKAIQSHSDE